MVTLSNILKQLKQLFKIFDIIQQENGIPMRTHQKEKHNLNAKEEEDTQDNYIYDYIHNWIYVEQRDELSQSCTTMTLAQAD